MPKNIIFYFSGTGNSFKAAQDIAAALGDTELLFSRGTYALSGVYERIGFVFPVYAAGVPRIMRDFIQKLNLNPGSANYIFTVATYNEMAGNSFSMLADDLRKKGVTLDYCAGFESIGNYIILYPLNKDENATLKRADEACGKIAAAIKNKEINKTGGVNMGFSAFYRIARYFYKAQEKHFTADSNCVSCGQCARLCPVNNIRMEEGRPVFLHKNCTNCLACVHWCPKAAIQCGDKLKNRGRYHHPAITAAKMIAAQGMSRASAKSSGEAGAGAKDER